MVLKAQLLGEDIKHAQASVQKREWPHRHQFSVRTLIDSSSFRRTRNFAVSSVPNSENQNVCWRDKFGGQWINLHTLVPLRLIVSYLSLLKSCAIPRHSYMHLLLCCTLTQNLPASFPSILVDLTHSLLRNMSQFWWLACSFQTYSIYQSWSSWLPAKTKFTIGRRQKQLYNRPLQLLSNNRFLTVHYV